ncbi:MAG TPA: outer membrane beta-barrel protein [Puia sp.]|nr:outer membrane beta-barrel protein [Puia sp.]
MSNVDDNNLDDLLRRAAEKYPLRTDSADFSKLVADLEKDPSLILPPVSVEDRRRRRRLFWLFLILPLAGGAYFAWHSTTGRVHTAEIARAKQAAAGGGNAGTGQPGGGKTIGGADGRTEESGKTDNAGENKLGGGANTMGRTVNRTEGGDRVNSSKTKPAGEKGTGNAGRTVAADGSADRIVDRNVSLAATKGTVNVNIPVKARATAAAQQNAPRKDKIKLQKPKSHFYVGILGSPDLSTIKMQSVKKVGYNFGLLLGYSLNSRWAIETGLYYDRKKYYTDGEYFSKEKQPRLYYYDIKTVDGFCDMWEIPLNVRYNFSRGDKMNWFATGGLSNYLMTGETYSFSGSSPMNPNWHQTWPYKTPYKYWFSILNLSVGYERRLGKIGNLRLEPFVRVPLTGVGTGSLSIMSAGLNIGITRRIW